MSTITQQDCGWKAHLKLQFEKQSHRTVLSRREHIGPLVIQKPFYPEEQTCHIYLIHPPGGVVGGDTLLFEASAKEQAETLITTPGATKFYRSNSVLARQINHLNISEDATFEWLPQETILFSGCHISSKTIINLHQRANFIGWEIISLGRPASNEHFDSGSYRQQFEIWQDEKPLLIERALFQGKNPVLKENWGLAGFPIMGTMVCTPANQSILEQVRELGFCGSQQILSVTLINNVLVCRYLGHHAMQAREAFTMIWQTVRPLIANKEACVPRIWAT